jgi:hypothetical protein
MIAKYENSPTIRTLRLTNTLLTTVVGLYLVFLHDFGPEYHVFSPLRAWAREAFKYKMTREDELGMFWFYIYVFSVFFGGI